LPKLKSHRGATKRFKRTGTGKIMRHRATARHILTSKSRRRKRHLRKQVEVNPGDFRSLDRMLL
jgi:large subunit ribosomal protein L35